MVGGGVHVGWWWLVEVLVGGGGSWWWCQKLTGLNSEKVYVDTVCFLFLMIVFSVR